MSQSEFIDSTASELINRDIIIIINGVKVDAVGFS